MRRLIPIFGRSIVSGIIVTIACTAYMRTENRYIGGVLFSFALYCIIRFGLALFTGKVGYIPENPPRYIIEVAAAFVGNILGVSVSCGLLSLSSAWESLVPRAQAIIGAKLADSPLSVVVLGFFCGFLMYLAIENSRLCNERSDTSLIFGTVMPVMLFIFCGFNHCIADSVYLAASGMLPEGIGYIALVVLGNSLGGMLIPSARKLNIIK